MMAWFRPLLLIVAVLLWTCPGAAESVKRYVDEKGTIHIGNVEPPGLIKSFPSGPSVAPAQPEAEPEVAPPPPVPQTEVEPSPKAPDSESVFRPQNQGVICFTPQPVREDSAAGLAASPAGSPGGAPSPAAAAAPPPPGPTVSRFKDEGGVLHITNVPALEEKAVQLAASPVRLPPKATWSEEAAWTLRAALPISRCKDRHGVIHITNEPISQVQLAQLAANLPPELPAAAKGKDLELVARLEKVAFSPGQSQGAATRSPRPAGGPLEANLDKLRGLPRGPDAARDGPPQGSVDPMTAGPPRAATEANRLSSGPGPQGTTIQRYRDRQGVIHIASLAPAGVSPPGPGVDFASPGARAHRGASAGAPGGSRPPPAAPLRLAAPRPPPDLLGEVSVRRNRQGTICISNVAPPARIWNGRASPELEGIVAQAARGYRLPRSLVLALIKVESNFVPGAVSSKGAMGLMQLMPGTAEFLGVRNPFCPRENILAGCRYLRLLLDFFNDSLPLALAAYNAGHQRVVAAGYRIPPLKETQEFVTQVLGLHYLTAKLSRQSWS